MRKIYRKFGNMQKYAMMRMYADMCGNMRTASFSWVDQKICGRKLGREAKRCEWYAEICGPHNSPTPLHMGRWSIKKINKHRKNHVSCNLSWWGVEPLASPSPTGSSPEGGGEISGMGSSELALDMMGRFMCDFWRGVRPKKIGETGGGMTCSIVPGIFVSFWLGG